MAKSALRIGVVGFEGDQFDVQKASELVGRELRKVMRRHLGRRIEIVSWRINDGIPKIAAQLAAKLGMATVSFPPPKGSSNAWHEFANYVHGLVRVGGGADAMRVVRVFSTIHRGKPLQRMLKEHEVEYWGDRPPLAVLPKIRGLKYVEEFLNLEEQEDCLQRIDQQEWSTELRRRVQHYGYKYDYRNRSIDASMRADDLPEWLEPMQMRLQEEGLLPKQPDQLIINEYEPGQGIADHIDCEPCFGDTIVSVSLGSAIIMNLTSLDGKEHHPLVLRPGSALVLGGPARYEWKHGIIGRKSDVIDGMRQKRKRRVSLTFRTVILAGEEASNKRTSSVTSTI